MALRENSEKPPIGGDLSVLPFLGLLASGFRPLAADLRQLPAESSASSEDFEYWNSRIVRGQKAGVTPYLTVSSGPFGLPGTPHSSHRTILQSWRAELLPARLRSPMCRTAAVVGIDENGRFPMAATINAERAERPVNTGDDSLPGPSNLGSPSARTPKLQ